MRVSFYGGPKSLSSDDLISGTCSQKATGRLINGKEAAGKSFATQVMMFEEKVQSHSHPYRMLTIPIYHSRGRNLSLVSAQRLL